MGDFIDEDARRGDGAEGALLAWLIGLPDGVDPTRAALIALAAMPPSEGDEPPHGRLRALLARVSQFPAELLAPLRRRRRAGARAVGASP